MIQRIRFKYCFYFIQLGDRRVNIKSKTLAYEIDTVVQKAVDNGRSHLNDEEAKHLIKLSEKLVQEYMRALEKMPDK